MFQRGYLLQELRRRWGRTLVTALGLAVGVGLVLGIIGLSQGLSEAQTAVLQPLSSIGTDILVTRVATSTATSNNNTQNNGGGGFFANGANGPNGGGGGGAAVSVNGANASDANALLAENSNVTTDLSKLGPAGTKFTHDFFLSSTLLSFPADALTATVTVPGVASATAGLTQLVEHQTGTVPTQTATFVTGGETLTTTATPAPLTDAEQTAVQTCLQSSGVRIGDRGQATATVTPKVGGAPAPLPPVHALDHAPPPVHQPGGQPAVHRHQHHELHRSGHRPGQPDLGPRHDVPARRRALDRERCRPRGPPQP